MYSSVVVGDLDIFSARDRPSEADAKLIVHPDAVLPRTVSLQFFKTITRRHQQVLQLVCDLQLPDLAPGGRLNTLESLDSLTVRKSFRFAALERNDHTTIVTCGVITVKLRVTVNTPPPLPSNLP